MRIVVLDGHTLNPGDNPWTRIENFGDVTVYDRTPADKIIARAKDADIVLTNKTPLSADVIGELKKLRLIAVLATGHNIVDGHAARERDIPVCNVPEYGTDSVAQFTFALLLELCHRIGAHDASVHAGDWNKCPDFCYWNSPLRELAGKKLGIVGYGRIGQRVADIGHAFRMHLLIANRSQPKNLPSHAKYVPMEELFAEADVVTLHCPQTKENTGFVNAALLGKMKKEAFLLNVSRGPLVNEQDLADALNEGKIAGAGLDVVSSEPPAAHNPLFKAKNCIITPHIAWAPLEARQRIMQTTAHNIQAFLDGKPMHVVN